MTAVLPVGVVWRHSHQNHGGVRGLWWITVSKARIPTTMSSARASIWSDGGGVRPTFGARQEQEDGWTPSSSPFPSRQSRDRCHLGGFLHQLRMGDLRIPVERGTG